MEGRRHHLPPASYINFVLFLFGSALVSLSIVIYCAIKRRKFGGGKDANQSTDAAEAGFSELSGGDESAVETAEKATGSRRGHYWAVISVFFSVTALFWVISCVGLVLDKRYNWSVTELFQLFWLCSVVAGSAAAYLYHYARWRVWKLTAYGQLDSSRNTTWQTYAQRVLLQSFAGYLVVVVCSTGAFLTIMFSGFAGAAPRSTVRKVASGFGLSSKHPALIIILYVWYSAIFGMFWDVAPPQDYNMNQDGQMGDWSGVCWIVLAAMEEVGWSGALFPALFEATGHRLGLSALILGVVWPIWHWPFIFMGHYGVVVESAGYYPGALIDSHIPDTPLWWSVLGFTLALISFRVILCFFQYTARSSLPSIVIHAAHNVFVISVLLQITGPKKHMESLTYMVGESGAGIVLFYGISAMLCMSFHHRCYPFCSQGTPRPDTLLKDLIRSRGEKAGAAGSSSEAAAGLGNDNLADNLLKNAVAATTAGTNSV